MNYYSWSFLANHISIIWSLFDLKFAKDVLWYMGNISLKFPTFFLTFFRSKWPNKVVAVTWGHWARESRREASRPRALPCPWACPRRAVLRWLSTFCHFTSSWLKILQKFSFAKYLRRTLCNGYSAQIDWNFLFIASILCLMPIRFIEEKSKKITFFLLLARNPVFRVACRERERERRF